MSEHEDEKENGKCNFGIDGQCALHGIEVERRKNMQALTDNIPKILTWQNRIFGWSLLVTLFVGGSFVYIKEVKDDMKAQYTSNVGSTAADIKNLSKQIDLLVTGQARTEERYEALLRSITDMNVNISTLTYLQFDKKDSLKKP